ncbi:MAG: hypothetical protein Q9217_004470 [Psora testacea]
MGPLPRLQIKRVAIIGAGSAGVAAAKYLLSEKFFDTIEVFEQRDCFGGIWNYCAADQDDEVSIPQTNPFQPLEEPKWQKTDVKIGGDGMFRPHFSTPMYDKLETNLPHSLMKHPDDPSLQEHQLFPTRETVLDYLSNYATEVKNLVKFNTQVTDIRVTNREGQDIWLVHIRDLFSNKSREEEYDAVCVANGHYSVPTLPDIKGIEQWNSDNPGVIRHSKFYRNPAPYSNKKTIIVGNSASGIDIAFQVGAVAKHPVLISQRSDSPLTFAAPFKEDLPQIQEFILSSSMRRAVRFADGRVETDIDAIVFCTGYYYSFPFLSSLEPSLIETGDRVQHLYKHLIDMYHPTLAFVGLPSKIIPFRTFEGQAAVVARLWSNRLELPSMQEMENWEENLVTERGSGRPFHVLLFPEDFDYHNEMVDWACKARDTQLGKMPPKWSDQEYWARERLLAIKISFAEKGEGRHNVKSMEEMGFDYRAWVKEQQHFENIDTLH